MMAALVLCHQTPIVLDATNIVRVGLEDDAVCLMPGVSDAVIGVWRIQNRVVCGFDFGQMIGTGPVSGAWIVFDQTKIFPMPLAIRVQKIQSIGVFHGVIEPLQTGLFSKPTSITHSILLPSGIAWIAEMNEKTLAIHWLKIIQLMDQWEAKNKERS